MRQGTVGSPNPSLLAYLCVKVNQLCKESLSLSVANLFKPTKNLIRPADSHSSWSMTDKEINLQRFKPDILFSRGRGFGNMRFPEYIMQHVQIAETSR